MKYTLNPGPFQDFLRTLGAPRLSAVLGIRNACPHREIDRAVCRIAPDDAGIKSCADPVLEFLVSEPLAIPAGYSTYTVLRTTPAKMRYFTHLLSILALVPSIVLAQDPGPSPTASIGCEPHGDHWFVPHHPCIARHEYKHV